MALTLKNYKNIRTPFAFFDETGSPYQTLVSSILHRFVSK